MWQWLCPAPKYLAPGALHMNGGSGGRAVAQTATVCTQRIGTKEARRGLDPTCFPLGSSPARSVASLGWSARRGWPELQSRWLHVGSHNRPLAVPFQGLVGGYVIWAWGQGRTWAKSQIEVEVGCIGHGAGRNSPMYWFRDGMGPCMDQHLGQRFGTALGTQQIQHQI